MILALQITSNNPGGRAANVVKEIASRSGGFFFQRRSSDEITQIISDFAQLMRNRYQMTFQAAPEKKGSVPLSQN